MKTTRNLLLASILGMMGAFTPHVHADDGQTMHFIQDRYGFWDQHHAYHAWGLTGSPASCESNFASADTVLIKPVDLSR